MISANRIAAPVALATGAHSAALALALPAAAAGPAVTTRPAVTIRLGEYFYKPALVTVAAGQKVTFVNVGKISHTVADSNRSGTILSRLIKPHELKPGAHQTISLAKPGVVYYLCTFHPTLMRGKIIVR